MIDKMPALFIGHGSPMNAIEVNDFTNMLLNLGTDIKKNFGQPKAVLTISAHWQTEDLRLTNAKMPKMIFDMYGFPQALYDVRYSPKGAPELASEIKNRLSQFNIQLDEDSWGLDHGTWAILKFIFPEADIPVLQLSMPHYATPRFHYEVGRALGQLRDEGVIILGSGNIVHNLRHMNRQSDAPPHDWARSFDQWVNLQLSKGNHEALIESFQESPEAKLSVPTTEHFLPLLYVLGASDKNDKVRTLYEGLQNASISMRSVAFESGL